MGLSQTVIDTRKQRGAISKLREGIQKGRNPMGATMMVPGEFADVTSGFYKYKAGKEGKEEDVIVSWPTVGGPVVSNQHKNLLVAEMTEATSKLAVGVANKVSGGDVKVTNSDFLSEMKQIGGIHGAISAAAGSAYEAAMRMAYGFDPDKGARGTIAGSPDVHADFDVRGINMQKARTGFPSLLKHAKIGDFKIDPASDGNRKSMGKKILTHVFDTYTEAGLTKRLGLTPLASAKKDDKAVPAGAALGYIPNFADTQPPCSLV
jgi:hypothetical protein